MAPTLLLPVALLLAIICWQDIATRTLHDAPSLALGALGLAMRAAEGEVMAGVLGALAVLAVTAALWRLGALGGGDAKLLAACTLLVGPQAIPTLVLAIALSGGVLALPYLLGPRLLLSAGAGPAQSRPARVWRAERRRLERGGPLPYALAIAAGTLLVLLGWV